MYSKLEVFTVICDECGAKASLEVDPEIISNVLKEEHDWLCNLVSDGWIILFSKFDQHLCPKCSMKLKRG